jgi:lysophospholipase L1-like esterase
MLRKLLLGLLVSMGLLALVEIGLRVAGFQHRSTMAYLRLPNEMVELFEPDPVLVWHLKKGVAGVSSSGFRGPPFESQKPADRLRIVVMGDSCIFGVGAENSLPGEIEAELDRRGIRAQVINAGVPGYSSEQGKKLLAQVLAWQPDVVLISYVWNDHWLSLGVPDSAQLPPSTGRLQVMRVLERSRLVQALNWLVSRIGAQQPEVRDLRVSPIEYAANLNAIAGGARARGSAVALMTAPTNHHLGQVPEYLRRQGFVEELDEAVTRHRQYNALVLEAARRAQVAAIDLELLLPQDGRPGWFWKDGIHFTESGHRELARLVVNEMLRQGLVHP